MLRIGIRTGSGDAPGLNAVIRAAVKTAINQFDCEVFGIRNGYDGFIEENGITGFRTWNSATRGNEFRRGQSRESISTQRDPQRQRSDYRCLG